MAKTTIILSAEDRTRAAFASVQQNFKVMQNGLDQMKAVARGVGSVLGAVGIGFSVNYFKDLIEHSIDALDHLNDLSKTTRISVEVLSGLQLAAKQTGSDLEGTAASINKLAVNMGKHAEAFAELGITAKDPLKAFEQLADILNAIEDPQQRAAVAATALGKSWQAAAPLLAEGSARIQEMVEKGTRLSGVTKQAAEEADHFNDRLAELNLQSSAFTTKVVSNMLPGLIQIAEGMRRAADESGVLYAALIGIMQVHKIIWFGVDKTQIQKQIQDITDLRKEIEKLEKGIPIQEKAGAMGRLTGGDPEKMKQELAALRLNLEWATRGLKNMEDQAKKTKEQLEQLAPKIPGLDEKTNKFLKKKGEFEKQSFEDFGGGQFIKTGMGGGGVNSPEASAFEIAKSYKRQEVELTQSIEDEKLLIAADGMTKQQAMEKQRAEDSRKIWENFVENVQRTLGSQLYEVMQGNFSSIGTAFKQLLQRMLADALAANLMRAMFAGGGTSGLLGLARFLSPAAGAGAGAGNVGASAMGSWFDGGAAHFAMGGIVSQPTAFAYGGGFRSGIMGEAGPEAIMPLRRDSSGRLGVSGGGAHITYAPVVNIDSRTDRTEVRQLVFGAVERGNADLVEKLSRAGTI